MADLAFPAVGRHPGGLRRIQVPGVAGDPALGLPPAVNGLGHRVETGVRIAAQDVQAVIQVIEHETWRDRSPEVLPGNPVHEQHPALATTLRDLAVPGTARRPAPDPVTADIRELVENPVYHRPPGVDTRHAYIVPTALAVRS
jgi:hypothetical protein